MAVLIQKSSRSARQCTVPLTRLDVVKSFLMRMQSTIGVTCGKARKRELKTLTKIRSVNQSWHFVVLMLHSNFESSLPSCSGFPPRQVLLQAGFHRYHRRQVRAPEALFYTAWQTLQSRHTLA